MINESEVVKRRIHEAIERICNSYDFVDESLESSRGTLGVIIAFGDLSANVKLSVTVRSEHDEVSELSEEDRKYLLCETLNTIVRMQRDIDERGFVEGAFEYVSAYRFTYFVRFGEIKVDVKISISVE